MRLSVIVPVHDNAGDLAECLQAVRASSPPVTEIVVVDDHSHDGSAAVAARAGARLVRLERNVGPGPARNAGARETTGDVLVFVDSDVVVARDTLARLGRVLEQHPDVAAVFGSYDATPRAPGLVSQYRNLLHHFVHQHGATEASTFWAGCGAIRRDVFASLGGFDEGRFARGVEDVELGYRVRAAGHRIRLTPDIQVTHLKRWTLASVIRTDAVARALPWSRLLLERRPPLDHLNVATGQRVSVALTLLAASLLPLALVSPLFAVASGVGLAGVVLLNSDVLAFFARARGVRFAVGAIPLLVLHYLESGLCYAYAWLERRIAAVTG